MITCAHNTSASLPKGKHLSLDDNDLFKNFNSSNKQNNNQLPFEQKVTNLRKYIDSHKVSWTEGCDTLSISRDNVLKESMEKINFVDLLKELKIDFKGEVSYDAGGIIREWFMVIINELESNELGIFEKSDCDDYSFVPKRGLKASQKNLDYFSFIGRIIAKALIDNITINLCFNKIIYKMIIDENISFEDMKFIDKPLYISLNELKNMDQNVLADLCMYYVYEYNDENGKFVSEDLIPNGSDTLVRDIDDYIQKRIDYIKKKYQPFIDELKTALFHVRIILIIFIFLYLIL